MHVTHGMRRLWRRVGRRGTTLLFLAMLDLLYPISFSSQPPETRAGFEIVAPWQVWAVLWVLTGLLCAGQAFARKDRLAFAAAVAMKIGWGSVALIGWVAGTSPRGWLSGLVWLTFAGFVAVVSTWTEEWDRL